MALGLCLCGTCYGFFFGAYLSIASECCTHRNETNDRLVWETDILFTCSRFFAWFNLCAGAAIGIWTPPAEWVDVHNADFEKLSHANRKRWALFFTLFIGQPLTIMAGALAVVLSMLLNIPVTFMVGASYWSVLPYTKIVASSSVMLATFWAIFQSISSDMVSPVS